MGCSLVPQAGRAVGGAWLVGFCGRATTLASAYLGCLARAVLVLLPGSSKLGARDVPALGRSDRLTGSGRCRACFVVGGGWTDGRFAARRLVAAAVSVGCGRRSLRTRWFCRAAVLQGPGVRVVFLGEFFDRSCRNRVLEAVLCSRRSCALVALRPGDAAVWLRFEWVVV